MRLRLNDLLIVGMLASVVAFNVTVYTAADRVTTPSFPTPADAVRVWSAENSLAPGTTRSEDLDILRDSGFFEAIAAYIPAAVEVESQGTSWQAASAAVGVDFWRVFFARPSDGRLFDRTDVPSNVVVISHALRTQRFKADRQVIGAVIRVSGVPLTIVGVAPPGFRHPDRRTDLWTLLPASLPDATSIQHPVVARLQPGVSTETVASVLSGRIESDSGRRTAVRIQPVAEFEVAHIRPYIDLFKILGALLMALVVGNVVCLLWIAHGEQLRATAIRIAIGAAPRDIARAEIRRVGALAAGTMLVAGIGVHVSVRALSGYGVLGIDETAGAGVGWLPAVWAAGGALVLVGVSVGIAAWLIIRRARVTTLRPAAISRWSRRTRRAIVLVQLAVPFVVLPVGVALFSQLATLLADGRRFFASDLSAVRVRLPLDAYPTARQQTSLLDTLLAALETKPESVSIAGVTNVMPLVGDRTLATVKDHERPYSDSSMSRADVRIVSASLFEMLDMRLRAGRFLHRGDVLGSSPSAVIDEVFTRQVFGQTVEVGRQVTLGHRTPWTVVGVVERVRESLEVDAQPTVWISYRQLEHLPLSDDYLTDFWLVFGARGADAEAVVKEIVQTLAPGAVISDGLPLASLAHRQIAATTTYATVASMTGALGLCLSLLGLYAVTAKTVQAIQRELAIRVAVGARRRHVVWTCISDIGMALPFAVLVGWGANRMFSSELGLAVWNEAPIAPSMALLLATCIVLLGLTAALWRPLRIAAATSPLSLLRSD